VTGIVFEWDEQKAVSDAAKQGVTFEEAKTVLADPLSLTIYDRFHSRLGDERFVTVGRSDRGRTLVVVHSDTDELVRIISAREATRRERQTYQDDD
jgi:uncharacterized protein